MDDERTPAHGGSIIIGLRELYAQIQQLSGTIAQLSAEVRMAAQQAQMQQTSVAQQLADIRRDQGDHETRLRQVESKQVVTPRSMWTAIATIVPIISLIVTIVLAVALG